MSNRNAQFEYQQHQRSIQRTIRSVDAMDFFNALTEPALLEVTEAHFAGASRAVVFADGNAVDVHGPSDASRRIVSARGERLGGSARGGRVERVQQPNRSVLQSATAVDGADCAGIDPHQWPDAERAAPGWRWHGRTVKLVDGTGISIPNTQDNQRVFPRSNTQAAGVGFPIARFVGVICLATGGVIDAAIGPFCGKGNSELGLLRQLQGAFARGDIMLGDAFYCNYFLIAMQMAVGVDVLFA